MKARVLRLVGCICFAAFMAVLILLFIFLFFPWMYALLLLTRLLGRSESAWGRRAQSRYFLRPGGLLIFAIFRRFLFVDVRYVFPSDEELEPVRRAPCVMISNHQHTVDAVVVHAASARAGIDHVRYVAKDELLDAFHLGRFLKWVAVRALLLDRLGLATAPKFGRSLELWRSMVAGGFPFINREKGDERALAEIEGKAALACAEGGSMGIFPEGTRFRGRKPDSGYELVNPPRPKGFLAIVRAMLRERPGEGVYVMNETFAWQTRIPESGKNMFAGSHFIGARLVIKGEVVGPFHDEVAAHAWLHDEWRKKDAFLGSLNA